MVLLVVYGLGEIVQVVVGKEIVVTRKIVVVEEIRLSDMLAEAEAEAEAEADGGEVTVVSRGKKQKSQ